MLNLHCSLEMLEERLLMANQFVTNLQMLELHWSYEKAEERQPVMCLSSSSTTQLKGGPGRGGEMSGKVVRKLTFNARELTIL